MADAQKAPAPLPPTEGRFEIVLDNDIILRLDLTPFYSATGIVSPLSGERLRKKSDQLFHCIYTNTITKKKLIECRSFFFLYAADPKEFLERTIGFTINYTKEDPNDPRELSELGEIRLWFVRLDAAYPWLPVLLDWRAGELARYAAMLVPHQVM